MNRGDLINLIKDEEERIIDEKTKMCKLEEISKAKIYGHEEKIARLKHRISTLQKGARKEKR